MVAVVIRDVSGSCSCREAPIVGTNRSAETIFPIWLAVRAVHLASSHAAIPVQMDAALQKRSRCRNRCLLPVCMYTQYGKRIKKATRKKVSQFPVKQS